MTPRRPDRGSQGAGKQGGKRSSASTARDRSEQLELSVTDRGRPRTSRALLRRVVLAALEHGDAGVMPVSLLLTDDAEIARIHGDYLDDPTPTDVISFDLDGTAEIVVSTQTAARAARLHGHACAHEVALCVVHGLLHLCGYDDRTVPDRAKMRRAERTVLAAVGIEVADVDA